MCLTSEAFLVSHLYSATSQRAIATMHTMTVNAAPSTNF